MLMMGKRFKKIEDLLCQFEQLTVFLIVSENNILHLSFSETHHKRAIANLTKDGAKVAVHTHKAESKFCPLLRKYFSGEVKVLPIQSHSHFIDSGTPFQKKVWSLIQKIPYGETRTYGELAKQMGNIQLSRAVGQACNKNPLALIIPCHRVVGVKGLTGFAGGTNIKKRLLALERQS